jgi:hypothetical protein
MVRDHGHEVFSVFDEARGRPHRGVIFMRLEDERAANKIAVLQRLLESYADRVEEQFIVVTETRVRFARS